jgi:predicted neutral ceramidase superfamily lipid hydrolase
MKGLIQYFYEIKLNKTILWCYLIWYVIIAYFYFDPSPKIWINAIGISAVIGTALLLSVSSGKASQTSKQDHWQTFRLYLMPFCVSSFSALIKDQGFIIVISPKIAETLIAILCCVLFLLIVLAIKLIKNKVIY